MQLASVLDVDISWFFGQESAAGNLPDDFLAMLSDHNNLEILIAAHSIASAKRKSQLVKIAQLFADEGDERGLARSEPQVIEPSLRISSTIAAVCSVGLAKSKTTIAAVASVPIANTKNSPAKFKISKARSRDFADYGTTKTTKWALAAENWKKRGE